MSRSRLRLAAFGLVTGIVLVAAALTVARICSTPIDVSGTTSLPAWVRAVKERDEIAFPAHLLLARSLTTLGCSPEAIALQWIKAAAHARTPEDLATTRDGLRSTTSPAGVATRVADDLCRRLGSRYASQAQQATVEEAGIDCQGVAPPEVTPTPAG